MRVTLLLLFALLACRPKLDQGGEPTSIPASGVWPADSLVLTLADSTEVWMVKGRQGMSIESRPCLEWGVELRNGGRRSLVPLLYTTTPPRVVDGRLVATLSNRCERVTDYVIDQATAQPTPRAKAR